MSKRTSNFLLGAGLAAAVSAGVVAFLTQTKKGQQLAKKGKEHASEITKKVAQKAETVRQMTKLKYGEIIDEVMAEYQAKKKITKEIGADLAKELKKEWEKVKKELKQDGEKQTTPQAPSRQSKKKTTKRP
ncbi:MAG: hypothetical protein A2233_00450 [Candidatus Kerfeldbacteria bacterium RIFOXYA2_FULL_38_24]|uniref:YtxH domain-containing protein n=1 Tax=Candidatus Kerfeldbacteria bacterium RIFOXYB2_FULL_38_14 TaxID=1798547 RepID=A0A1G2BA56_9BACT|nr:MAG: hypothetical protein A2233_00450 [Candidatus Kerfeldbacteria bacterium RIFOXYA2_FULL_38_24]OGY86064.1 MAG: hypothetical protein A2319_00655 [Candidatus Kerfeldbacteria bacterium RIFOXYB2_FULL_38_14]